MKCKAGEFMGLVQELKNKGGVIRFQARGKSMEPYINDGEIVWLRPVEPFSITSGDIVLYYVDSEEIGLHRFLKRVNGQAIIREEAPPFKKEKVDMGNIVARLIAIERKGRKINFDKTSCRLNNFFLSRCPLYFKVHFLIKKIIKLSDAYYFVPEPEVSLQGVADKYNRPEEVAYHREIAAEGLEPWELDFVNRFALEKGELLDIGCGAGREAIALAKLGFKVTAIDIAPAMIEEARRKAKEENLNIRFEVKSAPYLNYKDNSFDYILFGKAVYSYIPTSALRIKTLQEVKRILKPAGRAIFSYYTREKRLFTRFSITGPARRLGKIFLKGLIASEPGDVMLRYVSPASTPAQLCFCHFFKGKAEVEKEVRQAGLKVIEGKEGGYFILQLASGR